MPLSEGVAGTRQPGSPGRQAANTGGEHSRSRVVSSNEPANLRAAAFHLTGRDVPFTYHNFRESVDHDGYLYQGRTLQGRPGRSSEAAASIKNSTVTLIAGAWWCLRSGYCLVILGGRLLTVTAGYLHSTRYLCVPYPAVHSTTAAPSPPGRYTDTYLAPLGVLVHIHMTPWRRPCLLAWQFWTSFLRPPTNIPVLFVLSILSCLGNWDRIVRNHVG